MPPKPKIIRFARAIGIIWRYNYLQTKRKHYSLEIVFFWVNIKHENVCVRHKLFTSSTRWVLQLIVPKLRLKLSKKIITYLKIGIQPHQERKWFKNFFVKTVSLLNGYFDIFFFFFGICIYFFKNGSENIILVIFAFENMHIWKRMWHFENLESVVGSWIVYLIFERG